METFDFLVVQNYGWPAHHETLDIAGNSGGGTFRPLLPDRGRYRARFSVLVGGSTGKTVDQWHTFLRTVRGAGVVFKWKDILRELYYKITDEDIGTADGIETDFAIPVKYVDASTVTVEVGGVPQASGWSLVDNETAPKIRFAVAPSSGTVTVTCEFYYPVRFAVDPRHGEWTEANEDFTENLEVVEQYAEAHRV